MHSTRLISAILACALIAAAGSALAALEGTGLPLPRFVSLRAAEVNLRAGPGIQYPVDWVYLRRGLPVEVIAEYRTWRQIKDWQGTKGWIHQSMLTKRRTVIVTGDTRTLRSKPSTKSPPLARVEAAVVGTLLLCPDGGGWCRVEMDGFQGWLRRVEFWGTQDNEVVD
jgi:SH3-like domain-containing protein